MPRDLPLTDADYSRLAEFRYSLRVFLQFSAQAAAAEGLTPRQHQTLLAIRAHVGRASSIGWLAERLCLKHHTVVELVQRLEKAGLIHKRAAANDRRQVLLELSAAGTEGLERLTRIHRQELRHQGAELVDHLSSLTHS